MRRKWRNPLSRPAQTVICIGLCLVLLMLIYASFELPTLTMRQAFRRTEKAHMVGPSKIVDTLDDEYTDFDKLFVGETEHGITFFGKHYTNSSQTGPFAEHRYLFTYREKTGDLTIATVPNIYGMFWSGFGRASLPVYLFDEYPQATRAELVMTITDYSSFASKDAKISLQSTANRSEDGYFCFIFTTNSANQAEALCYLSDIASGNPMISGDKKLAVIPATVRLYDPQDNLILERDIEISY